MKGRENLWNDLEHFYTLPYWNIIFLRKNIENPLDAHSGKAPNQRLPLAHSSDFSIIAVIIF